VNELDEAAVASRLGQGGFIEPELEAAELIRAASPRSPLSELLARRLSGEPLEWITGSVVFAGHRLLIDPGVYVPRPQTEEMAKRAALFLEPGRRATDLCTGSGAVAAHLQLAVPGAFVVATDCDPLAVSCARRNGVPVVLSDLGDCLRASVFDVVTAVAPYVPTEHLQYLPRDVTAFEPLLALDGGEDGLGVLVRTVVSAGRLLRRGGHLLLELGGEQDEGLGPVLLEQGFQDISTWYDEEGDLRGLLARFCNPPARRFRSSRETNLKRGSKW
jgi:release factor glutamine methyltransferase